ncbi:MAG: HlyD family efflux transporter periplasmic adaptor subunit [Planctomycetes bacterium]|nr:HlyD family efflux transporter periplasmic adaptor subunit [Planctomycetota bacterium]
MSQDTPLSDAAPSGQEHTSLEQTAQEQTAHEETWRQIEDVLDHISQRSRSTATSEEFFAELLDGSIRTLAANGGAIWLRQPEGLRLEYQVNLASAGLGADAGSNGNSGTNPEERSQIHRQLVERIAASQEPRAVAPQSGGAGGNGATGDANPTEYLLCCVPVVVNDESRGLIEIVQRPDVSPAACEGFLQFLGSVAVLASDFLRNSDLRTLKNETSLWNQFGQFSERIHKSLKVGAVASSIANEARPLIECDRVSVAVRRGTRLRIEAVSGADSIDRRADTIRLGEALIKKVAATRQAVWHEDSSDPDQKRPPQVEKPLNRYLDDSPARVLGVLPLVVEGEKEACGALIIERFEGTDAEQLKRRSEVVGRHSADAVANALQHSNLPLLWLLRIVSRMAWYLRLRQLPKTTVVLSLLAGIGFALATVPADFVIEGRGELQPLNRRGIFASTEGVVAALSRKIRNAKGEPVSVAEDEMLLELRSSSLEFEITRVTGELRTARQSLNTVEIQRNATDDPAREEELAARETELAVQIESLESQQKVLTKWKGELTLASPIAGQVLTFDPVAILENRPVRQGERLLQVADVDGPWVIEVRVADQNIGYVNDAARELQPDLDVSFVTAVSPEKTWSGKVRSIRRATTSTRDEGPIVLVTVDVDRSSIPAELLRPGATVIPHIHCGTRPIGFVWFHELIHAIRTKLLF